MSAVPITTSLPGLAERFDVFFVDQFGVLHDGSIAYPGAIDALAALKDSGATVVMVSNSGRRSAPNEDRLRRLGFREGSWDHFLSSGEVAWRMFQGGHGHAPLVAGSRVMVLTRGDDTSSVEDLQLDLTATGADAELILLSGSEGDLRSFEEYREMLAPAAARDVPMVCTNPDNIMLTPVGPRFGSGRIAQMYEEMGGSVTWIGKPYPEIYRAALEDLGQPDPTRVVGVGDSLEHDVAGARGVGLSAALVRTGVIDGIADANLEALYVEQDLRPDFILPAFTWQAGRGGG